MTEQGSNLLQKALSLSEEERADLACSLLNSLDPNVDEDAAGAWDKEIARRISDLGSGQTNTVSWEEVRNRLSSKLPMATKKVEFHEAASLELDSAFDWHLERSKFAAARFLVELNPLSQMSPKCRTAGLRAATERKTFF